MNIFVTGGTGYIGSRVVAALTAAGHGVTGLARSDESAARLQELGADVVRGDLQDAANLRDAAADHDAMIHMAMDAAETVAADHSAVEALLDAARHGPQRTVIYTSGCWVLGNTGDVPADEEASTGEAAELVAWRPAHEQRIIDAADDRLSTAVIRPGIVYGGRGGILAGMFKSAVERGRAEYVGDGRNRWSLVHREDLAQLYRAILERRARGVFHAVDGSAPTVGEVARAASQAAGAAGATEAIPLATAREQMGSFADALCLDQVLAARRSGELGWRANQPPFVQNAASAFEEWNS